MGIKAIVLIAVTVVWLYEMTLHLIRMRSADNPVPENVSDVYDAEQGWGLRGSGAHPLLRRPAWTPLAGRFVTLAHTLWPRAQVMLQSDRPESQTCVESSNSHPIPPSPPRTSRDFRGQGI